MGSGRSGEVVLVEAGLLDTYTTLEGRATQQCPSP